MESILLINLDNKSNFNHMWHNVRSIRHYTSTSYTQTTLLTYRELNGCPVYPRSDSSSETRSTQSRKHVPVQPPVQQLGPPSSSSASPHGG